MTYDATEFRLTHEIFEVFSEEFSQRVVTRALEHRTTAAKDVRKKIDATVRRLQIDGFRDPSRAPNYHLVRPVLDAVLHGDLPLARAVLNIWMDSHEALRNAAAAHLADRDVPTPEHPDAIFESSWTTDEWLSERNAMTANGGDFEEDDVGLMLCLVSRRFPAPPPLFSRLFRDWIDELKDWPPDASEWAEVDAFTKWVRDVSRAKSRELVRWRVSTIASICSDIRAHFDEDLRYLNVDPDSWATIAEDRPFLADPALASMRILRGQLEEYQPCRPQAASRDEEVQRSAMRGPIEDGILRLVADWEALVAQPDPIEQSEPATPSPGNPPAAEGPESTGDEDRQVAFNALEAEYDQVQRETALLRGQSDRLQEENRGLKSEKEQLNQEIDGLKAELSRSRTTEEHWRRAFVYEKGRSRDSGEDDSNKVESVRDAITKAQDTFRDKLLIKLNSKSDQNTSFESPREVFDVLAWLATAYRRVPPEQIGNSCPGWFYKPNQSEATKGKFRDWYRTSIDGTTWDLSSHLGKGTSHDPRHTIRIAFAWDEANERVIVGFVGMHQRDRQT